MKKTVIKIFAVCTVICMAAAGLAGCSAAENDAAAVSDTSVSDTSVKTESIFKNGYWAVGDPNFAVTFYDFYNAGEGSTKDVLDGTGLPFTYEIEDSVSATDVSDNDVSASDAVSQGRITFHMGSADDNTPATYIVLDENTVLLMWDDGDVTTLMFVTDEEDFIVEGENGFEFKAAVSGSDLDTALTELTTIFDEISENYHEDTAGASLIGSSYAAELADFFTESDMITPDELHTIVNTYYADLDADTQSEFSAQLESIVGMYDALCAEGGKDILDDCGYTLLNEEWGDNVTALFEALNID